MTNNLNYKEASQLLRIGLRAKLPEWDNIFIQKGNGMIGYVEEIFLYDSFGNSSLFNLNNDYKKLIKRIDWISY